MTLIENFELKCPVCNQTSSQPTIMSTNTGDYPDLDLRPAEMQRSTMFAWVDECPHCGYVSFKLDNETEISAEFLKTEDYLTCEGNEFKSDLSRRFYRHSLILKAQEDYSSEFNALLYCAWDCDDNNDELAVKIRKMALKIIDKFEGKDDTDKNNLKLIKADLLRRTGQFDRVINEFKDLIFENKLLNDIITFQIELSMKKDCDRHAIREIVKDK